MKNQNIPITGFMDAVDQLPNKEYSVYPLSWCAAEPASYVTKEAFDHITLSLCTSLLQAVRDSRVSLAAVYLDLHGAMVSEEFDDGEAEILRRVRQVVGADIPVMVSLDWHANLSEEAVELATGITIYRTYPHLDMHATGKRCFELLQRILAQRKLGNSVCKAFRRVPYLIPITAQYDGIEPSLTLCRSVVATAAAPNIFSADFAQGFPLSDGPACHPTIICYGSDQAEVDRACDALLKQVLEAESQWSNELYTSDDAVTLAMRTYGSQSGPRKPVVVADVQDNPGAGCSSDTVGVLRSLVKFDADAVLALLNDPQVAKHAHSIGVGNTFSANLGGKLPSHSPFSSKFEVLQLSDGKFMCTGEMMAGVRTDVGATALLRVLQGSGRVRVVVASSRFQCLDAAVFTHIGIDLSKEQLVVVKSSVHFRAAFTPISCRVIMTAADGENPCDLSTVPFQGLRTGMRIISGKVDQIKARLWLCFRFEQ